jgi:serine/threonine protein kinase
MAFIRKTSQSIGVPLSAFGNAHDDFERYDFDGDGGLEEHECYRLVKSHLKAYRKQLGHCHSETNMPAMTPAEAGLILGQVLGHGAFGTVLLATDRNGETKCVKKLNKADMPCAGLEELTEEFQMTTT